MMLITAEEFESGYCARSGITRELYASRLLTLPDCTSPNGWAAVSKDALSVNVHGDLYVDDEQRAEFERRARRTLGEH